VSKSRDLEKRLDRTEQQLQLVQRISRLMVREVPLDDTLSSIVSMVVEFMECDSCLLYLLERNELVLKASNTAHPSVMSKVRLALTEGLTGWVARERRLLAISREAYTDSRFKFFSDLPEDTYEAFLSSPIISRRGIEGVINVQHRNPHPHSGFEMELLTTVGEQIGCLRLLEQTAQAGDVLVASSSTIGTRSSVL
jgi:uroporphyrinogen-III synthase